MSKRLCSSCGVMPAASFATECESCLFTARERKKVRSFVPLFGDAVKRLPNVGECITHRRRGCTVCLKGEK